MTPRNIILALIASSISPCDAFVSPQNHRQRTAASTIITRGRPLNAFDLLTVELEATADQVSTAINSFFQTQPYLAAFLTCSVKASAADVIAQTQESSSEEPSLSQQEPQPQIVETNNIDISRNLGFLFYGGLYQGVAQNFLYNNLYPLWFGGTEDATVMLVKEVLADNLIFAPFLCLPVAYAFKAAFTSQDLSLATFQGGLEKYVHDVQNKNLLMQYWRIWVPAQFMTFGVIPPHFRIAFVAAISFFWICILSSISASEELSEQQDKKTIQAAISTE